jgi:hypothetical protein
MSRHLITLLALLFPSVLCAETPVHLFILSGQSNMAGMNPRLGLEPEAKLLFPDARVVYFKVASGGKPIRLWVKEWNQIAGKHKLTVTTKVEGGKDASLTYYQPILEQYKAILEKHPDPASVTFCWMQGERDAREKLGSAYSDALKQLIANLRRDLGQPEMNFVIGRLSDFGKPGDSQWQKVRAVQVAVASEDMHGAWVDCDDLNDKLKDGVKRNDLHYTQQGYELLGRRFVRQARALIDAKKPAADGRPK